jgi:uncharacterized protein YcbK (DUF882 family)
MAVRKTLLTCLATIVALVFSIGSSQAGGKTKAKSRRSVNDKGSTKVCTDAKGKKRRCHRVQVFQGHGVAKSELRVDPLDHPSGDIWVFAENLNEEVKLNIFRDDGSYNEESLAKLDEIFRCKRTNEVRAVNPKLYEQLSRIQDHFDKKRIDLVSGFRFAERNSSRHFHASAMDIRIRDITIKEMYAYAQSLDPGGMGIGIYPNSGFIHVDLRAPGDPSYRWTDLSGHSGRGSKAKKTTGRTKPARKPVS